MDAKEEIRLKLDVAEVIGDYLPLKPAGSGAMKGLCPFHPEKTPSFHVSRERQIWKCFGCDKGGDVFAFVMEMEGMSFREALKHLAQKAGVVVPEYRPTAAQGEQDRLRNMNELAAKFYSAILENHPAGQLVREYVLSRQIPPYLVEKFHLGAAPAGWDNLVNFLLKKNFAESEILASGLALKKRTGSGLIDRFRNRLMIPLADATGRVVGFTGRVLPGALKEEAKYMNSPETMVYHKGSMLYGLHLAKTAIRHQGEVIIVEGNLDVIASHKAGVENVVGSSGTALTEQQLRTLARYTRRLVFCLDDDAAGFAAAKRVVDLAVRLRVADPELQFDVRCLVIPPGVGKDPDEIVKRNSETWQAIAQSSHEVIEYFFQKVLRQFEEQGGAASVEARRRLIDELLPQVASLPRPDERHLYLLRIADATHVGADVLESMIKPISRLADSVPEQRTATKTREIITSETQAVAFLFGAAMRYEALIPVISEAVNLDILTSPYNELYTSLKNVYRSPQINPSAPPQSLFSRLRAYLENHDARDQLIPALDEVALVTDEILAGLSPLEVKNEVEQHLALIASAQHKKRRKQLEEAIRQAELSGQTEELTDLLRAYGDLLARGA